MNQIISMAISPNDKISQSYSHNFSKNRMDDFMRVSKEQYNKELEEEVGEIQRGEVLSHEEVVEMAKTF